MWDSSNVCCALRPNERVQYLCIRVRTTADACQCFSYLQSHFICQALFLTSVQPFHLKNQLTIVTLKTMVTSPEDPSGVRTLLPTPTRIRRTQSRRLPNLRISHNPTPMVLVSLMAWRKSREQRSRASMLTAWFNMGKREALYT